MEPQNLNSNLGGRCSRNNRMQHLLIHYEFILINAYGVLDLIMIHNGYMVNSESLYFSPLLMKGISTKLEVDKEKSMVNKPKVRISKEI